MCEWKESCLQLKTFDIPLRQFLQALSPVRQWEIPRRRSRMISLERKSGIAAEHSFGVGPEGRETMLFGGICGNGGFPDAAFTEEVKSLQGKGTECTKEGADVNSCY